MKSLRYVIGIDEAGRGPLAGPVAVGVALVDKDFDWQLLPGVTDSKQLTVQQREEIFRIAWQLKAATQLEYAVSMVSAPVIDRIGIVPAVNLAMRRALKKIEHTRFISEATQFPESVLVKLDGSLHAPAHFLQQETIIKGDQKEKVIGLASIMAKVTRDRYMVRKAAEPLFAPYDFSTHKGYGTKKHRAAIKQLGLCDIHRHTFCKNLHK